MKVSFEFLWSVSNGFMCVYVCVFLHEDGGQQWTHQSTQKCSNYTTHVNHALVGQWEEEEGVGWGGGGGGGGGEGEGEGEEEGGGGRGRGRGRGRGKGEGEEGGRGEGEGEGEEEGGRKGG